MAAGITVKHMRSMLARAFLLALAPGILWVQAQGTADLPVFRLLKQADPSLTEVAVLHRAPVNSDADLVIAIGTPKSWPGGLKGPVVWWGEQRRLGVFLQERARPDRVYSIAIEPGFADCAARIERATATDTVISCTGEKPSQHPHQKFVYDVAAKKLAGRFSYLPFAMQRIFSRAGGLVIVGSDTTRLVAVDFQPDREPEFELVEGIEAQSWTSRLKVLEGMMGTGTDQHRYLYLQPEEFEPVRFGSHDAFTLVQEPGSSMGPRLAIRETQGSRTVRHPLPQPAYEDFAKARPARVRNGYTKAAVEFNDGIGPWMLEGDRLWFGKTFYDGEGLTGIGGFGYFDTVEKKYRLFTAPEVADYSISAIQVDSDAVWMALVRNGEWGGSGSGVLRFDRRSGSYRKLATGEIGRQFMRAGERLILATDFGISLVQENQLRRYFVDRTSDGRLRVARAEK
jgi:hypothetical protein